MGGSSINTTKKSKDIVWRDIIWLMLKQTIFSLRFWFELLDGIITLCTRLIFGFGFLIILYRGTDINVAPIIFYLIMIWVVMPILRKLYNNYKYKQWED